ncbi:amidohydrolase family protein [Actinomycetaceae bacterium MB13-C1-2]|nr:amidohydrolase family protein [Actinomycetaceae bacterium MB13-C1-2]
MGDTRREWRGLVVLPDEEIADGVVITESDRIIWVGPAAAIPDELSGVSSEDLPDGAIIIPGLIDVHCHGGGGASFPDSTDLEQIKTAAGEHLRNGTTTLIASLVTAPVEILEQRAALLAEAVVMGIIEGIHFEGPFLSEARCGAQDPRYLIPATPDVARRLVAAAKGKAVSMTIAPERVAGTVGQEALGTLVAGDILPSWGHTDSGIQTAEIAVRTGREFIGDKTTPTRGGRATVTHLFNGMRPLHHRDPGPISVFLAAAERGEVVVEMINDGTHLDPLLVHQVLELVGRDNAVFVTDAMAAAGMPDGDYVLGPQAVRVEGGVARLAEGGAIAGGTARLLDCVRTAVLKSHISLVDAVYLGTVQGARILGLTDRGELAPGKRADLVVLGSGNLDVLRVVRGGELID